MSNNMQSLTQNAAKKLLLSRNCPIDGTALAQDTTVTNYPGCEAWTCPTCGSQFIIDPETD